MCDQMKSDCSTAINVTISNDNATAIDVCEGKENDKLNYDTCHTDDIVGVVTAIDAKSMAMATADAVVVPNTITTVAVVQQKLELTPKTVESESQTDITVTNDYCKSLVVAPVAATGANNAVVVAAAARSDAVLITADCDDTIMKSTADTDCIESKSNDAIALNTNVIDASLKKENDEFKSNNNHKLDDTTKMVICDNDKMNYMDEPEMSLIEIKEKLIEIENNDGKTADSESEEDDELKPLMTFNHAVIDNQDYYSYSIGHSHHQYVKHFEPIDPLYSSNEGGDISQEFRVSSLHRTNENLEAHHINDLKDSSCENIQQNLQIKEIDAIPPSEIPDDQMCANIVEQVEFYFSNESILRDAFLLKHVRRNKEGFVSLKLISSFKRVRQLTKDWRVVGYAIRRKSRNIELNDLGTKIRRSEPLPSFDETMPSRTIVACDLPIEKLCIEKVSDIFSKCGEIALIRILRPGMGIPVDVRQFMNKYPEMQQKECALVEFVESHSARNALNLNGNFTVFEMVAPRKKTGKKASSVTKMIENYKFIDHNYERSRGGGGGGGVVNGGMNMSTSLDNNYKYNNVVRRNSADYYPRPDHQQFQHQQQSMQQSMPQHIYSPRKYSFNESNNKNNINNNNNSINNEMINYGPYSPRRISSCSMGSGDYSRKYSSCSEGYSSCSELSRRTSTCSSDQSRRTSNCSDYCPCSRRSSQCSDVYRRMSQCSEHNHITNNNNNNRKFSNGSGVFSNAQNMRRRISMDSNYERKISTGSMGSNNSQGGGNGGLIMHEQYNRKFSQGGFDPNHKLSNTDQYYNDRRISVDSGYDRKLSFGSDYSGSPRSRSNSFLMCHQHKNIENVVRTPIGPDGSKGFTPRTRKLGQIVPPV